MTVLAVKLPDVGEGVTESEVAEWFVKVGDIVQEDDTLAAVLTDKAAVEIPSLYAGKIVKLGCEVGETLAVGAELVLIETDANPSQDPAPEADDHAEAPVETDAKPSQNTAPEADVARDAPGESEAAKPAATKRPAPVAQSGPPRAEGAQVLASPAIRARARAGGIDLRQVTGMGPAGRITSADLDAVFAQPVGQGKGAPSGRARRSGTEEFKVIGMRRKIAERMSLANARIPHITVVEEVDVTELEDLRAKLNADRGDKPKLTLLPFITTALANILLKHPEMNAHFDDDAGVLTRHAAVNTGIAAMTDAGLVVPVLRNAEALGLFETAIEIARLSDLARTGKASRDELTGSTITITSLGPLGALATTPIINHPEVAILGINKMAVRPMWDGAQFQPRKMMNISASFDHRVIDGWDAAVFVQAIKKVLESPALMFVEV